MPQLQSSNLNFCSQCSQEFKTLMKCVRCKNAAYCSKECQTKHWGIHKFYCSEHKPQAIKVPEKKDDQVLPLYPYFLRVLQERQTDKYETVVKAIAISSHDQIHANTALDMGIVDALLSIIQDDLKKPNLPFPILKQITFALANYTPVTKTERLYISKYSILVLFQQLAERNGSFFNDYLQILINLTYRKHDTKAISLYLEKNDSLNVLCKLVLRASIDQMHPDHVKLFLQVLNNVSIDDPKHVIFEKYQIVSVLQKVKKAFLLSPEVIQRAEDLEKKLTIAQKSESSTLTETEESESSTLTKQKESGSSTLTETEESESSNLIDENRN